MRLFSCSTFKEKARLVLPNKVLSSTCSYFKSPWIGSRSSFQERGEGVFSFCAGGHKGSDPPWWLLLPAWTGEGACRQILQKLRIIVDSLGSRRVFFGTFCYPCFSVTLVQPCRAFWYHSKSREGPIKALKDLQVKGISTSYGTQVQTLLLVFGGCPLECWRAVDQQSGSS